MNKSQIIINDTTVEKVIPETLCSTYPNYLFCLNFCKCDTILAPTSVDYKNGKTYISMPRGEPLTANSDVNLIQLANDLVQGLAYFESYNLVYGDIKPQNVVYYYNRYCLIDFDLLIHKKSVRVSQSHRDVYGEANKLGILTKNFNQVDQAMYALAYTLAIYSRNRDLFNSYESVPFVLESYGMKHNLYVSTTAKCVCTNPEAWIEQNFNGELKELVFKLVGPNKVKSFNELCHVNVNYYSIPFKKNNKDSKFLYEHAENTRCSLVQLFHCYNLFYRYPGYSDDCYLFPCLYGNDELVKLSKGWFITEFPSNYTQFEEEYTNPGSWIKELSYPTELNTTQNLFNQNKHSLDDFFK